MVKFTSTVTIKLTSAI